jgi:ribosomal protein S18 acetylase RimI-like enzyme
MPDPIRVRADLVPYTAEYSSLVRSWLDSPETYSRVCRGRADFPPSEDIVDSWQRDGVTAFMLLADRKPVAYGELWERPTEMAVEITHLMVDPFRRSEGYGTRMLKLLCERASERPGVQKMILFLTGNNEEALGCYLKSGFELVGTTQAVMGLKMVRYVSLNR